MSVAIATPIAEQKKQVRAAVLKKRAALTSEQKMDFSHRICQKIAQQTAVWQASCVAAFYPTRDEVDIRPLLTQLVQQDITVALPRVITPGKMAFHRFEGAPTLEESIFPGFYQPTKSSPTVNPQLIDFLIIPAVACDKKLNRLGYGGGFYDRFLINMTTVFSCAPLFACQQIAAVPTEQHDCPVGMVICEN